MEKADPAIWLARFLDRRALERPDPAKPLYAYRCSDDEFQELRDVLRTGTRPPIGYYARVTRDGAALFCLFAAEWWRRTHEGGPWKWAGILEGAGWAETTFPRLYEVVENGLGYWNRPLLRIGPRTGFLVTLACEGGLPLRLVTSEGTALRDYLLAVLEEFQLYRPVGYAPEELAARGKDLLPRSLQQDVVYRLSGQLIDEIWRLQRKVGGSNTPIRDLDRTEPGWRDRLPLLVPDGVARALLNPLVEEAAKLARGGACGLRMRRWLQQTGESWLLRGEVVVPASISEPQLLELLGTEASNLPGRFELYLEDDAGGRVPLALATQTERGERKVFRLEALRGAQKMEGPDACAGKRLRVEAGGRSIGPVGFPGGAALMDLPWVFTNKSATTDGPPRELAFLGQGSVSTRYAEAFVAAPWDCDAAALDAAECELVSEIVDSGRAIFRVCGAVSITDGEGNVCRVRTAADQEAAREYQLTGSLLQGTLGSASIFRGAPSMLAVDAEGRAERIAPERLEWHAAGHKPITWRPISAECVGVAVLRLVDEDGLRHCDRAAVVPVTAEIRLQPSGDFKEGRIELIGFQNAEVTMETSPGLEIRAENSSDGGAVSVHCLAAGDPPAEVLLRLQWAAGRVLDLRLPYPSVGNRFIAPGGRVLANEDIVPVERLSGVVATGTTTKGLGRFLVTGELCAQDVPFSERHFYGVSEALKEVIPGRFELDLRTLQESLREIFAASDDLGAFVGLAIESLGASHTGQRLMVSRFDLSLVADQKEGEVRLSNEDLGRLGWKDLENLHVEAAALWRPSDPPVELEPVPGPLAPGRWLFEPERRAAGPWMILGRDGDWNRMRPLRWNVPGKSDAVLLADFHPQVGGALATALCIEDPDQRTAALDAVLDSLAEDCGHDDWHEIYAFLERFRGLPASTLDVTERMIAAPRTAVVALLGAPDAGMFASVWSLLEELPFLWSIVPLKEWVRAGNNFAASLRRQLGDYSGDTDALVRESMSLFLKEIPQRQAGFETLAELMRVAVLGDGIEETSYLRMVGCIEGRAALRSQLTILRQDLIQCHVEDEWPPGPGFASWLVRAGDLPKEIQELWQIAPEGTRYRVPVLNAPVVAAIAAACDIPIERHLIFEIRRLRRFDPQWFDEAYSCMLAIAVGVLLEQDTERIGIAP